MSARAWRTARQVTRTVGCRVIGVDITQSYVDTARALTRADGTAERIQFFCTELDGLANRTDFDEPLTRCHVHK